MGKCKSVVKGLRCTAGQDGRHVIGVEPSAGQGRPGRGCTTVYPGHTLGANGACAGSHWDHCKYLPDHSLRSA